MFRSIATLTIFFAATLAHAQTVEISPLMKSCSVESHDSIMIVGVDVKSLDRLTADVNLKTAEGELTESCTVGYSSEKDSTVSCNLGGSEIKIWISGSTSSLTMSGPDMEGKITSDTAAMSCGDIPQEEVD